MRKVLPWLAGGAGWLLAIGFAVWAIGAVGRSHQRDKDLQKAAIHSFKQLNDTIAATRKQVAVLRAHQVVKVTAANLSRHTVDSILAAHPVATAPASCAPWTGALSVCQKEAISLREALALADSVHGADSTALALVPPVLDSGVTVLKKKQDKWLFGLLPKPQIIFGVGVTSSAVTKPGLALTIGIPIR